MVSIRRDMQFSGIGYVGRDSTGSHGPLLDEFSPVALAWLALAMPFACLATMDGLLAIAVGALAARSPW